MGERGRREEEGEDFVHRGGKAKETEREREREREMLRETKR